MPLLILPFLGSGFVPTQSMPSAIRWFAEYQPFTPVVSTVRGLIEGGPIGRNAILAIAWSVAITAASYCTRCGSSEVTMTTVNFTNGRHDHLHQLCQSRTALAPRLSRLTRSARASSPGW